jgi:hypothetical protein
VQRKKKEASYEFSIRMLEGQDGSGGTITLVVGEGGRWDDSAMTEFEPARWITILTP